MALLTSTETLAVPTLPAESVAVAVIVWAPSTYVVVLRGSLQLIVPVASWGEVPSTVTLTFATALLSEAVPVTVTVPLVTAPDEGTEMATAGGVVSHGRRLLQVGVPLANAPPPPKQSSARVASRKNQGACSRLLATVRRAAASRRVRTDIVPPGWMPDQRRLSGKHA
jgi:hypothetical protein